ncbi:MAG: hypothetical protein HOV94_23905 [Saccharothrix sp.]|nr:hypothetical protein [Saccharothrix sp.]
MPAGIMPSWPKLRFRVAFNHGADGEVFGSDSVGWLDVSSRLRGEWSADLSGRQYELDQVQSGQLSVTLENKDRLLDPLNTASPLTGKVRPMRPCRLDAVWPVVANLASQALATGTTSRWVASVGTLAPVTGLTAAPSGQTTASAWTVPAAAPAGSQAQWGLAPLSTVPADGLSVTPGEQITLSTYLSRQSAGGDASVQLGVGLAWFGYDEAYIATTSGAGISVPRQSSWSSRVTLTGTAPAGAVTCRVVWRGTATTTLANTVYATGWQLERGAAATAWVTPGTVYDMWAGYVERWPQTWDYQGTYDLLQITCIDQLAALARQALDGTLRTQLSALSPRRMHPLSEPKDSTAFYDAAGIFGPAVLAQGTIGAGEVEAGTSVEGTGSYGNAGPVARFNNPNPGQGFDTAGSFLVLESPGPPTSGGWTRIIAFRAPTPPPVLFTLWAAIGQNAFTGSGNASRAWMYISDAGNFGAQVTNAAGLGDGFTVAAPVCDGNWHIASVGLDAAGTTMRVSIDGGYLDSTLAQDSHPTGCVADLLGCTATYPTGASLWLHSGDLAFATEIPTFLDPVTLNVIGVGFTRGWAGDPGWIRAGRIISLSGYRGPVDDSGALTAFGGLAAEGDTMSALQLVADSLGGTVTVTGGGTVMLHGRAWRFQQPGPTLVFGEDAAAGEIPYNADYGIDSDPTHIYNEVTVSNTGAGGVNTTVAVSAVDYPSRAEYLPRPVNRSTNLNDGTDAAGLAAGILYEHRDVHPRVSVITVDVSANPAALVPLLGTAVGVRVRVMRRPASGAAITLEQFIEHISWAGDDDGRLQWRAQLSPAPPVATPWAVATSTRTTLAASAAAGATSITLNALPGAATNPAAAELGTETLLEVGTGATSEWVRVASVAATTPGYSTVVVTLQSALLVAHASGQQVTEPYFDGIPPGSLASLDAAGTLTATGPLAAY